MPLRDYQSDAVERIIAALKETRTLVFSLPTGAGKTQVAAELIRRLALPTVFAAHRRELITQAAARFRDAGIPCGIVMAGHKRTDEAVQVGSVQSLSTRAKPPAELLIIDEAHRSRSEQYRGLLAAYPTASTVGLSATPFRLDGKGLGDIFSRLLTGPTSAALVRAGWLVPAKVYVPPGISTDGLKVRAGEFEQAALADRSGGAKLTGDLVEHFRRHGQGPALGFAVGVANSQAFAAAFREAGIAAEHLDGTSDEETRRAVRARLEAGETKIVWNADLMGEGSDYPFLRTVVMARPTASLGLFLQQLGRGTRPALDKPSFTVLDHAGNFGRHADRLDFVWHDNGLSVDAVGVTLEGAGRKPKEADPKTPGVRRCPACFAFNEAERDTCWSCGAALPRRQPAPVEVVDENLRPLGPEERAATTWDDKRRWWRDAFTRSEKTASRQFRERFHHYPPLYRGRFLLPDRPEDAAARLALLNASQFAMGPERGLAVVRAKFAGAWPPAKQPSTPSSSAF